MNNIEYWMDGILEVIPVENVYSIRLPSELAWISFQTNLGDDFDGKKIVLQEDLDLSGQSWIPISSCIVNGAMNFNGFNGIFDGGRHHIKISIFEPKVYVGLFGNIGEKGSIENLCVEGYIDNMSMGGLICSENQGQIINCSSRGVLCGLGTFGGICAHNSGLIESSANYAELIGDRGIGGICFSNSENAVIKECYNYGDISGGNTIGGICSENEALIRASYNEGVIRGVFCIGGITGIGRNIADEDECEYDEYEERNDNRIVDCHNSGDIIGNTIIGGICGQNEGSIIVMSFSTGHLQGNSDVALLCGLDFSRTCRTNF